MKAQEMKFCQTSPLLVFCDCFILESEEIKQVNGSGASSSLF